MARPLTRAEEHRPGMPRRCRAAAAAPGPGPGAADPQQSALQRHQVHARRGPDRRSRPAATPPNFLVLTVSDTGVGIAEEDQQTIFEKFRQGRTAVPSGDAMTREYSGSGLGLSIVKELCRLLGGEVSLAERVGQGEHVHRPPALGARRPAPARRGHRRRLRGVRQAAVRDGADTRTLQPRQLPMTMSRPFPDDLRSAAVRRRRVQRQSRAGRLGLHPPPSGLRQGKGSLRRESAKPPTTAWSSRP